MSASMNAGNLNKSDEDIDDFCDQLFDEWDADDNIFLDDTPEDDKLQLENNKTGIKTCADTDKQAEENRKYESHPQDVSPIERFRPGYLWVSDLTRQSWCEQQLSYTFTVPTMIQEDPVMTQGTDLHLARELAVHDVVQVKVSSSEDIWAIKVLNLLTAIQAFHHGKRVAREVPVFGAPFGEDVWVVGLIDELQFDPEMYTIDLSELKTKQMKTPPSKAQKKQHRLQVMLYKVLFDDLVKGKVSKYLLAKHMKVSLTKEFGKDIKQHIQKQVLSFQARNLNELIDHVFQRIQTLTCVNQLSIEYVHQETKQTLFHNTVKFSQEEVQSLFKYYLQFWRGQRSATGVEIEEAWKCQRCDFEAICDWRQRKSEECAKQNVKKHKRK